MNPPDHGIQAQAGDLVVSPDGTRVFVASELVNRPTVVTSRDGRVVVRAYDATDGEGVHSLLKSRLVWSEEFRPVATGCDQVFAVLFGGQHRSLATSPSGDLVYFSTGAAYYKDCAVIGPDEERIFGAAVFAVRADTGEVEWERFQPAGAKDREFCWGNCHIAVAPGPDGGDPGSLVLVTGQYQTNPVHIMTFAYDGVSGQQQWQAHFLKNQNNYLSHNGGNIASPDGTRLHIGVRGDGDPRVASYDIRPAADLSLTVDAAPDPVTADEPDSVTFTVDNAGPKQARDVSFTATGPESVTVESITPSRGTCTTTAAAGVSCGLETVEAGQSVTVQLALVPDTPGELELSATVSSDNYDPEPDNNQATTTITVVEQGTP